MTDRVIDPRLGGCGCQYDAGGHLFADRCVCPEPAAPISPDVATIVAEVCERSVAFVMRQLAGDPAREISRTRRLPQADLDSGPVRRARVRYWHTEGHARALIAHSLYPNRFPHPGPFDTSERLQAIEENLTSMYGRSS